MRSERPLEPSRTFTIEVDGRPVACETIGGVANAVGRSRVQTRRLVRTGYLPAAPYRGRRVFGRYRTDLWPLDFVIAIELAAEELDLHHRNATAADWAHVRRRADEMHIEHQLWSVEHDDADEPRRPVRWRRFVAMYR